MENLDENPIRIYAHNFVQKFLPQGITDAHSFLYDWDKKYDFAPTESELEVCLKDYTTLIVFASGENILYVLDMDLMLASELVLSYLSRAVDKISFVPEPIRGRLISTTSQILSDVETFMDGRFRGYDALKRITSINEYLNNSDKIIPLNNRVSEAEVARILSLIANPPNMRDDPNNPNYIRLFDGGRWIVHTGHINYEFSDGTLAIVGVVPWLSVSITFPDGRCVSIIQEKPE